MERDYRMDFLRGTAILAVLLVHTITQYPGELASGQWMIDWIVLHLRPCIAIFLFAAGFFFRPDGGTAAYLFSKLRRIIPPYLVFSVIALVALNHAPKYDYTDSAAANIAIRLLLCNTLDIYYFVFVITYLYLLAFALLRIDWVRRNLGLATLILLGVNLLHGAYYYEMTGRFGIDNPYFTDFYRYRLILAWPFYFFLGLYVRQSGFEKTLLARTAETAWVWIACLVIYNALFFAGSKAIFGYNSVMGTIYSVSTIAFLYAWARPSRLLGFLSNGSYAIYLSHFFFVMLVRHFSWHQPLPFYITALAASLLGSSLMIVIGRRVLGRYSKDVIGV